MLPRLPPALEWLEGRLAPATIPTGTVESATAGQIAVFAPTGDQQPQPVALPSEPYQVFATAAVPSGTPTGSGQVFFSTPAPTDPLMSQIGRQPQASLKLPASGGSGQEIKPVEVGYIVPAAAPADAEQGAGEGDGDSPIAEPPPAEETVTV